MSTQIQRRRGTTAQHASFTGAVGETTIDTDKEVVVVHDGVQVGGYPLMRENGSNSALALGSAATPSLKFTGDTNTGIYSPGADQVAISTGGTGRLFVDASGNVGISAAPDVRFAFGDFTSNEAIRIRQAANGYGIIYFANGSSGANLYQGFIEYGAGTAGDFMRFGTAQNERLRITSAGLVGVGTSSPQQLLHVHNSSAADARLKISNGTTGSAQFDGFEFNCSSTGLAGIIQWEQQPLYFYTNNGTAVDPRLVITAAGNVGIGTSSPANGRLNVSSTTNQITLDTTDTATYGRLDIGHFTNGTFIGTYAGSNTASDLIRFGTGGTTRMTLDASGRVGIGTTSPGYTLETYGATNASTAVNAGGTVTGFTQANTSNADFRVGTITNHPLRFFTNSTEKAAIDSSGRLLVGTSSFSGDGTIVARGSSAGAATQSFLVLQRGQTNPANDLDLGIINFTDAAGSIGATISAAVDQASGWGSGDYPTRLVFSVTRDGQSSPTEAMRIGNNGSTNFLSTGDTIVSRTSVAAGTTNALYFGLNSSTAVGNGNICFVTWSNGDVQNTNNSYGAYSDIKLKENIVDASSQWDDIKALQVRNYNLKEGQTHKQIGLIAQEVEPISPGLVNESPDRDNEGNDLGTVTKSVNYSVLYMKAVKALQEAMERIEQLEAKVAALEAQ